MEASVVAHLTASGLRVTTRFPNRLVVGATGSVAALERAFGVEIHAVERGGRRHYAAINEPALPVHLAPIVVGVIGLDDLSERRPRARALGPVPAPNAALGTAHCCAFSPNDLVAFHGGATGFDGTGETIVIAGAYAWNDADNTAFNGQWGLPPLPAGSGQVCTGAANSSGCRFSNQNSIEIALDVEYAHGIAPGARILNYMAASTTDADFTQMYNRIVTDNPGHVVSTSWGACEIGLSVATQQTDDNIFATANAIGQSWFAASGDNGSRDCANALTVDNPANSPHVMGVGGTTPTCSSGMTAGSPACGGYGAETAWSGSGGGVSQLFARPGFQTGCGVPAGDRRLVPDVALEANPTPGNYVAENGFWYIVGGTSDGAPQWAGFVAQLNQKRGGGGLGNPGTLLYGLCGTGAYHDITTGSNGDYSARTGYDLVTGLGTIEARNFFAGASPVFCLLDVDGRGGAQVSTDVVYIARRLLGLTPVPPSFRALDATIPPDTTIAARIDTARPSLDVDMNGRVEVSTDIVYIARHLAGLTPVPPSFRTLNPSVAPDATIAANVDALCP
jgi:kumamolisin